MFLLALTSHKCPNTRLETQLGVYKIKINNPHRIHSLLTLIVHYQTAEQVQTPNLSYTWNKYGRMRWVRFHDGT